MNTASLGSLYGACVSIVIRTSTRFFCVQYELLASREFRQLKLEQDNFGAMAEWMKVMAFEVTKLTNEWGWGYGFNPQPGMVGFPSKGNGFPI